MVSNNCWRAACLVWCLSAGCGGASGVRPATESPSAGASSPGPVYASLAQTDFIKFFHVSEVGREHRDGEDIVHLKTQNFRDQLAIDVIVSRDGRVSEASLLLRSAWIGDEEHANPLANDIAKSFLNEFRSPLDAEQMSYFTNALMSHAGSGDEVIRLSGDADDADVTPPDVEQAIAVYVGRSDSFVTKMLATEVSFEHVSLDALGGAPGVRIRTRFVTPPPEAVPKPSTTHLSGNLTERLHLPEMLTGEPYVALLNADLVTPKDMHSVGSRGLKLQRLRFLGAVCLMLASTRDDPAVIADVFDGAAGHSIVLRDVDDDLRSFEYMDPWGSSSFLQEGHNGAGVAAVAATTPGLWRVSADEMGRVLYDIIVPQHELEQVSALAERLSSNEGSVRDEYRSVPAGSYVASERRLTRLTLAFAAIGNQQAALAIGHINVALHPKSEKARRALERAKDATASP